MLLFLYDGFLYIFELEKGCVFNLIYLDGVILDFSQFEEGILDRRGATLTISLLMRDL